MSTEVVFDELRQEIRKVILPETEERTVTIIMPDGKKVKQVKSEDEQFEAIPLKLEGSTKKGNIYVRPDGKRVRLVKRKEKRRKEKLKRKKMKEVANMIRNEESAKEQQKEEEAEPEKQIDECDLGELSWQQVEEIKECILREAWERERNTAELDENKRIKFLLSDDMMSDLDTDTDSDEYSFAIETDSEVESSSLDTNESVQEEGISTLEAVQQGMRDMERQVAEDETKQSHEPDEGCDNNGDDDDDDDSLTPETLVAATKAETPLLDTVEILSTRASEQQEKSGNNNNVDWNDSVLLGCKKFDDSNASTLGTVSLGQDEEDEDEFRKFCTYLRGEHDTCLPKSIRSSLLSMDVMDRANRMKRLSAYAEALADLQAERLRAVNRPKHHTQGSEKPN